MRTRRVLPCPSPLRTEAVLLLDEHEILAHVSAENLLAAVGEHGADVVIADIDDSAVRSAVETVLRKLPGLAVVARVARPRPEELVELYRLGVAGYLGCDDDPLKLVVAVREALDATELRALSARLTALVAREGRGMSTLVGDSHAIERVREQVRSVATTDLTVLVTGESGTGKEVVASLVHALGPRAALPFVAIHCGAVPETLVDSELFGHVRGAFTGAHREAAGCFVEAGAGTVFLDEIGTMPMASQARLLRVLQAGRVVPVGGTVEREAPARVVAATNEDLAALVQSGRFRSDLYYRLDVVRIEVPPLRERRDDVPLIAAHLLGRLAARDRGVQRVLAGAALQRLMDHDWPGNVRELENVLQRAIVTAGERLEIRLADLEIAHPTDTLGSTVVLPPGGIDLDAVLARVERDLLAAALELSGRRVPEAARLVRLPEATFRRRMARLDR